MSFLKDEEFIRLETGMTKEEIENLLLRFRKICVEEVLKVLPGVIGHLVRSATTMHGLSEKFYKDHPELVDHKDQVVRVMEGLEGQHPEMDYSKLMQETGIRTKQSLILDKTLSTKIEKRPAISDIDAGFGEI